MYWIKSRWVDKLTVALCVNTLDQPGEVLTITLWGLKVNKLKSIVCYINCCTCRLALQQGAQEMLIAKELADIKTKEEKLNSILPALEGIRKATLPLQNSLGVPLDKKRDDQEMALLLPS